MKKVIAISILFLLSIFVLFVYNLYLNRTTSFQVVFNKSLCQVTFEDGYVFSGRTKIQYKSEYKSLIFSCDLNDNRSLKMSVNSEIPNLAIGTYKIDSGIFVQDMGNYFPGGIRKVSRAKITLLEPIPDNLSGISGNVIGALRVESMRKD